MPTLELQVEQLSAQLEARFFAHLPPLQRPGRDPADVRQNQLSRSLAAFAISTLADVDNVTAATSVIDDYEDNGVDAIHFDRPVTRLFLLQSKFKRDGAAPNQAEMKKFCDGVRDLRAQRYNRFNDAFQQKLNDVEEALESTTLRIVVVVAWTGRILDTHAQRELDDLIREFNEFHPDLVSVELFNLDRAHGALAEEHAQPAPDIRLTLENWYRVETPFRAFYGQVSVAQLAALFATHQKALFERNIRNYLGSSGVNDAIRNTLREEPAHLFYLNNGITAVCTRIRPLPTAQPAGGEFDIAGFSVVNGAQTVGSIAQVARDLALTDSAARVFITLIEIGSAPGDFGSRVTFARNYQNQVRHIDFAALDPVQERIRRELAISGITYHYKPSQEARRRDDVTMTMEEAAVALACFSGRPELAVTVKKEVGKLLDRNGTIYASLFPANLDAGKVCRFIRVYRFLDQILTAREIGREKLYYRHLRYFILSVLSRRSGVLRATGLQPTEAEKQSLSRELDELAAVIYNEAVRFLSNKGWLAISRNLTDSSQLAQKIMQNLATGAAAAATPAPAAAPAPANPNSSNPPPPATT